MKVTANRCHCVPPPPSLLSCSPKSSGINVYRIIIGILVFLLLLLVVRGL